MLIFSLYNDYYGLSGLMGLSFGGYINVGTGTGTPSKSDTTLFTQILQKRVGFSYTVSNYDAVNKALSITQTITVLSSELNGLTITEIGLGGNSNLSTKVMLDNPIAKTDTIEVQINYTITLQLAAHSIQTLTMLGYPYVTNSSAKKMDCFIIWIIIIQAEAKLAL